MIQALINVSGKSEFVRQRSPFLLTNTQTEMTYLQVFSK